MTEEAIDSKQPDNKTKTFKIKFRGKEEEVTIRKMGYKERNDFLDSNVETMVKVEGGKEKADIRLHPFKQRTEAIMRLVVKAPFDPVKDIDDIDVADVGDEIYAEIEKFNKLNQSKKSN